MQRDLEDHALLKTPKTAIQLAAAAPKPAPRAVATPAPFRPSAAMAPVPPRPPVFHPPGRAAQHGRPPQTTIQPMWGRPGWGSAGSTPSFLVDKNAGKTKEDLWPGLPGTKSTEPNEVKTRIPTAEETWRAAPVTSTVVVTPDDSLDGIKTKILAWDRRAHGGSKARLSTTEIATLTTWAEAQMSTSGRNAVFTVIRGAGTGDYAARDQLKIVAHFSTKLSGDKFPTYHVTLT